MLGAAMLAASAGAAPAGDEDGMHLTSGRSASFQWVLSDSLGYRWDISSDGTVANGTNNTYGPGMQLRLNGSSFSGPGGGTLSQDGAEAEIGPWNHGDVRVFRRVFINGKAGYCRWIDIFENTGAAEATLKLEYYFDMGQSTQRIYSSSGGAELGEGDWGVVTDGASSNSSQPAVVHVFATPAAKLKPSFSFSQGNDSLYYRLTLTVPARKASALCFFEAQRRPFESAVKCLREFNPSRELTLVPAPLRTILLNMRGAVLVLGDVELKRNDQFDLLILRNDDEIHCQILTDSYELKTAWGDLKVPASDVLGLVSRSADRNLVKLVLAGGQIVAGELAGEPLKVRLPGGTELNVPPKGLRQAAYRVCPEKPLEVRVSSALVHLRQGEQLAFEDADASFALASSHGTLTLAAADLQRIELDTPGGGLHRAVFRNGSTLAGLLAAEELQFKLSLGPVLKVPRWQVQRILLANEQLPSDALAKLTLRNGDVLFGHFTDASWNVEGKFGPVRLSPADLAEGEFSAESLGHVTVALRNGTKLGGRIGSDYIGFKIDPGPTMKVFVGQIEAITGGQPPKTSGASTQPASGDSPAGAGPLAIE